MQNTNQPRTAMGKYRKKSKLKRFLRFVAIITIFVIIAQNVPFLKKGLATIKNKPSQISDTVQSTSKNQSALDKIKERENFKKRIENQAEQVYLSEEIAARQAQITVLKNQIEILENDLATKRTESLSL